MKRAYILGAGMCLIASAAQPAGAGHTLRFAPSADSQTEISAAIIAGLKAEAHHDAAQMLNAAARLSAWGAHPQGDQPDLAQRWQARAIQLGARPSTAALRGRALGPGYRHLTLGASQTFSTEQTFLAGQRATIHVAASRDAKLRVMATSSDGAEACSQTKIADHGSADCAWIPIWTDRTKITIINTGLQPQTAVLLTN